jgi:hypothetical protein
MFVFQRVQNLIATELCLIASSRRSVRLTACKNSRMAEKILFLLRVTKKKRLRKNLYSTTVHIERSVSRSQDNNKIGIPLNKLLRSVSNEQNLPVLADSSYI